MQIEPKSGLDAWNFQFTEKSILARRKTSAKIVLGKVLGKGTLAEYESCYETSGFRQNPAFCGVFSFSTFQLSAFQRYPNPPFPRPPVRPTAVSGATRQEQIPSNQHSL
jgi:hypothetical protein